MGRDASWQSSLQKKNCSRHDLKFKFNYKRKKVFGFGVFVYEREKQRSITLNQVIVEYIIIHNTKYFTFFDVFSCDLRKDDCMNRGWFYVYRLLFMIKIRTNNLSQDTYNDEVSLTQEYNLVCILSNLIDMCLWKLIQYECNI